MLGYWSKESWFIISSRWSGAIISIKYVILENTFSYFSSRQDHLGLSCLHSSCPVSFVGSAICKKHLTIAISFIHIIVTFIYISRRPSELTIPMLFVILVGAFIFIAIYIILVLLPNTNSMFQSISKFSFIDTPWFPYISSLTTRFSILVLPIVCVAICKKVSSFSMLSSV